MLVHIAKSLGIDVISGDPLRGDCALVLGASKGEYFGMTANKLGHEVPVTHETM